MDELIRAAEHAGDRLVGIEEKGAEELDLPRQEKAPASLAAERQSASMIPTHGIG